MGDVNGFLKHGRQLPPRRPVPVRLRDWKEVYEPFPVESARDQGARCMDCGIPFCHEGCPLGNLIPEWNDLVYRDDWSEAVERLHATNNFPEFTGRLCPAPCEGACVLGINDDPVTIERIEYEIVERAWAEERVVPVANATLHRQAGGGGRVRARPGWPRPSSWPGPATGWWCSSGPRSPAGCCATGSPSSRWRRRCSTAASTRCGPRASSSGAGCRWGSARPRCAGPSAPDATVVSARSLVDEFDSVRAGRRGHAAPGPARPRAGAGRDPPGHGLPEAVQPGPGGAAGRRRRSRPRASTWSSSAAGTPAPTAWAPSTARGRSASTSWRSCPSRPPAGAGDNPWPTWPLILRTSSALEEGGERVFSVTTAEFLGRRRRPCPGAPGRAGRGGLRRRRPARLRARRGLRVRAALRAGAAGHGVPRDGAQRGGGRARARGQRPGQRGRRRSRGRPTSTGCSCAGT